MKTSAVKAVSIVTAVLLAYTLLGVVNAPFRLMAFIFTLSPFLVVWMVWNVLSDSSRKAPELADGEEWGYADRPRDSFY
jgi:hypothetical protein